MSVYPAHTSSLKGHALSWSGRKFYCSNHQTSHEDADAKCRTNGMSLALIESRPLMDAVWKHCGAPACSFCAELGIWLANGHGAKSVPDDCLKPVKKEPNSNYYVCANGLVLNDKPVQVHGHGGIIGEKWRHIWFPDRRFNKGECFEIIYRYDVGFFGSVGLNDQNCRVNRWFVCEQ